MREIKFRGKSIMPVEELNRLDIKHENGWVYGSLIANSGNPYIVGDIVEVTDEYMNHEFWVKVIPETVGQFINAADEVGEEIFEGDVLTHDDGEWSFTARVAWSGYEWYMDSINHSDSYSFDDFYDDGCVDVAKIGNVHDYPELLEVAE